MLRFEDCDGHVTFDMAYDQDTGRQLEAAQLPMDAMRAQKYFSASTLGEVLNLAESGDESPIIVIRNGMLELGFANYDGGSDIEAYSLLYKLGEDATIIMVA